MTDGGLYSRAQLEANKVFDVVVNSFSLLDGRPADRKQTPTFEPQTLQSQLNDRNKLFHQIFEPFGRSSETSGLLCVHRFDRDVRLGPSPTPPVNYFLREG